MRSFLLLLSVLIITACTLAPPAVVDDTAQEEADIQAINRINELWAEAAVAGDMDALLALLTDDIIWMEPNIPAIVGKEAFREYLQSGFDEYNLEDTKVVTEEIKLADDWAYSRGSWSETVIPKAGGDPIQVTGKWMSITERQVDGSWKISRNSANPDAPLDIDQ